MLHEIFSKRFRGILQDEIAAIRQNSFFYLILAAFAVMIFVEWPLLNSAYKGKEKDFNDKLFLVAPFIEETLIKDTVR
jgi:hypothetical protein